MRNNVSDDFRISLFETDNGRSRLARDIEGETVSVTSAELDSLVLTTNLSRSNPNVESVVFSFAGTNIEFTDNNGNFVFRGRDGLDLEPGTHTLIVEGYARDGGRGRLLERREVEFTIEEPSDFDPAGNLPTPGGNDPFDPGSNLPDPDGNDPFDPSGNVPNPGGNGGFDPAGNLPGRGGNGSFDPADNVPSNGGNGAFDPAGNLPNNGGNGAFDPAGNLPNNGGNGAFDPAGNLPNNGGNGAFDPAGNLPNNGGNGAFDPAGNLPSFTTSRSVVQDDGVILGATFADIAGTASQPTSGLTPQSTENLATAIEDLWFNQIDIASFDDLFSLG